MNQETLKRLLFSSILLFRQDTLTYLKQLKKEQWLTSKELSAIQEKRLQRLLTHTYHHVPYYKKVFDDIGIKVEDGKSPIEKLKQLPFMDKKTLREKYVELKSDDLENRSWVENTSGGSTGEPAKFIQDKHYSYWRNAQKLLYDGWTDCRISCPKISIWGSVTGLSRPNNNINARIYAWLKNKSRIDAYDMSDEKMAEWVKKLNHVQPTQILAYAESIYELSKFIQANSMTVHSPKAIITTAGVLYPDMRKTIEAVFGSPVFNRYGSREVGDIACECNHHRGLHISMGTHYVELVKPDGRNAATGETGEIIITLLKNYAMPLIRYRIEDMGIFSETDCSCGRKLLLLKEVQGRVTDFFTSKNGKKVFGGFFRSFLFYKDWVKKYQIIQHDINRIEYRIVPNENIENWREKYAVDKPAITAGVRAKMGTNCMVEFSLVDHISASKSGKYRYTISKII